MSKGIPVIFATARPPRMVKLLLPSSLYDRSFKIFYNGALIIDHRNVMMAHHTMDVAAYHELMDYMENLEYSPCVSIEATDQLFCNHEVNNSFGVPVNPHIVPLEKMRKLLPTKILLSKVKDEDIEEIMNTFGHKFNIFVTDSGQLVQMSSKNASKEMAVAHICNELKIPMSHVIAFGDDNNDLGMMKRCGYSVAMGNATEEIKKYSAEITETNDNDGVAMELERIYKNNLHT